MEEGMLEIFLPVILTYHFLLTSRVLLGRYYRLILCQFLLLCLALFSSILIYTYVVNKKIESFLFIYSKFTYYFSKRVKSVLRNNKTSIYQSSSIILGILVTPQEECAHDNNITYNRQGIMGMFLLPKTTTI